MTRRCGECTLCCKLLPVRALKKGAGQRCDHQSSKGCGIYRQLGFPRDCALWSCMWLIDKDTAGLRRPDRAGYVIDTMPDLVRLVNTETGELLQEIQVLQVWVDPARPEAWRDPALLRFVDRLSQQLGGIAMLVRFDEARAITALPPSMNSTGRWQFQEGGEPAPTRSGNLLLDRMLEEQRQRGAAA